MKRWVALMLTLCLGFSASSLAQSVVIPEKPKPKPKRFLVGGELRSYRYEEPGFVTHSGLMYGVWGEWYWNGPLGGGKTYANLLYGALDYDGSSCDLDGTNCRSQKATTNTMIVRLNTRLKINITRAFNFFVGAGGRYLYDRGEGSSFYDRVGLWYYLPLGGTYRFEVGGKNFLLDAEYDLLLAGSIKSYLSQVSSVEYSDLSHSQNSGSGYIINLGYQISPQLQLYVYLESWNLARTDDATTTNGKYSFHEPENQSSSFGVKLGLPF